MPSDLKNVIIDTYSVSGHGSGDSSNFISTDKLYLLSPKEVEIDSTSTITQMAAFTPEVEEKPLLKDYSDTASENTRQLDYYKNNGVTTDSYSGAVKTYQGSATDWWLRAAYSNYSYYFYIVNASGDWNNRDADRPYGVAPAFRIR